MLISTSRLLHLFGPMFDDVPFAIKGNDKLYPPIGVQPIYALSNSPKSFEAARGPDQSSEVVVTRLPDAYRIFSIMSCKSFRDRLISSSWFSFYTDLLL